MTRLLGSVEELVCCVCTFRHRVSDLFLKIKVENYIKFLLILKSRKSCADLIFKFDNNIEKNSLKSIFYNVDQRLKNKVRSV